jgi:DnaJ-class molecular chaperone
MQAEPSPTELCSICLGSGSGIYNALSPKSTCEVCEGTGLQQSRPEGRLIPIVTDKHAKEGLR